MPDLDPSLFPSIPGLPSQGTGQGMSGMLGQEPGAFLPTSQDQVNRFTNRAMQAVTPIANSAGSAVSLLGRALYGPDAAGWDRYGPATPDEAFNAATWVAMPAIGRVAAGAVPLEHALGSSGGNYATWVTSAESKAASRANHDLWTTPEPGGGLSAEGKILYRGTEVSPGAATPRVMLGDLGMGAYTTPQEWLAAEFGGGPKASVAAGTRMVHSYALDRDLAPHEVAREFYGGHHSTGPLSSMRIVRGDGAPIYEGPWKPPDIEQAFSAHPSVKVTVGDPQSIGLNQIAIRDPSILKKSR